MPREFSVALIDSRNVNYTTIAGTQIDYIGLTEPLGQAYGYMADLFRFYRYLRVTAVTVQVIFYNRGLTQVDSILAVGPYNDNYTLDNTPAIPGSTKRSIPAAGGMDRVMYTRSFDTIQHIGNLATDKYWVTGTQSVSTTPIDNQEPVIVHVTGSPTASASSWTYELKCTMHCQFFDLRSPA
jgi:hypothetical protein